MARNAEPAAGAGIRPLLIVVSAPSGGGKTTLCQQLLATTPAIRRAITCTTRRPRVGEQDGVDYHFLSEDVFRARVERNDFLEHATVHGHRYGTLRSEVFDSLEQDKDVLLNVDVQGAASIRAQAERDAALEQRLVLVFLTPPSLAVLRERLQRRGTDSPEVIQRRLDIAREEIARWRHFDYLLISTTVSEDLRRMQVILEAERMRSCRAHPPEP